MTTQLSYTRGGEPWAPQFIEAIDETKMYRVWPLL